MFFSRVNCKIAFLGRQNTKHLNNDLPSSWVFGWTWRSHDLTTIKLEPAPPKSVNRQNSGLTCANLGVGSGLKLLGGKTLHIYMRTERGILQRRIFRFLPSLREIHALSVKNDSVSGQKN